MMNEIILELIKAAVVGGAGMAVKMYLDIRELRSDLDCSFAKIRALEVKIGTGNPPCTKTSQ